MVNLRWTRRQALALLSGVGAWALDQQEALSLLAALADALSNGSAAAFLAHVERSMSDRAQLEANIRALVEQCEVGSSVQLMRLDGDAVVCDWILEIRSREPAGGFERRRSQVRLRVNRAKRIVELQPLDFFRPLAAA